MRVDVTKKTKEQIVGISDITAGKIGFFDISAQEMKLSGKGNENEFPLAFPNIFRHTRTLIVSSPSDHAGGGDSNAVNRIQTCPKILSLNG